MRSRESVVISVRSSLTQYIYFGSCVWLVHSGHVIAVYAEEVYFADEAHTRAQIKLINEFKRDLPHVRVPAADFDFYVASSAMRGLRPLLGKPSEPTPQEPA